MAFFQKTFRVIQSNHHTLFGASIAVINLYNIKFKKRQDNASRAQYALVSLVKGAIYGSFYPFSLWGMMLSIVGTPHAFKCHFIPLSVYGDPIHHELPEEAQNESKMEVESEKDDDN